MEIQNVSGLPGVELLAQIATDTHANMRLDQKEFADGRNQ